MQKLLASTNYYIYINDLLQPNMIKNLINKWTEQLHASSPVVVASQFAKLYSSAIILPRLKRFFLTGEAIDLPEYLQMEVISGKIQITESPVLINKLRDSVPTYFSQLFACHLTPLWNTVAKEINISKTLLWENTFIYVSWLYQEVLRDDPAAFQQFQYLTSATNSMECFHMKNNPFESFDRTARKKCCLYFKMPEATGTCKNCPLNCSKKNIRTNLCQP